AVGEEHVHGVRVIVEPVEVVAGPALGPDRDQDAWLLEVGIASEGRRPERSSIAAFSISQVGEREAQVVAHRVALDPHLAGEAGVLGGLLDALAGAVVLPPMIEAANAVALHPAGAELRPAVRAAGVEQV